MRHGEEISARCPNLDYPIEESDDVGADRLQDADLKLIESDDSLFIEVVLGPVCWIFKAAHGMVRVSFGEACPHI